MRASRVSGGRRSQKLAAKRHKRGRSDVRGCTGIWDCPPPDRRELIVDRAFRGLTHGFAWFTILLVVLILAGIAWQAWPVIERYKWQPLTSVKWDGKENFGILPEIGGTIYSSVLGVGLGSLFGVAVAIFLTQDFIPPRIEVFIKNVVELLAAIPSVVYGLWGIFVVIPTIRPACDWLHVHLGWIPIFGTHLSGPGLLPAALVLAIMVLPTVSAISRDSIAAVPPKLREAAYGLGATRWETIRIVILPTAARGIYGSIILAFGRALGETMALAMLVGNNSPQKWTEFVSIFSPSNTLAALIANKFPESSTFQRSGLDVRRPGAPGHHLARKPGRHRHPASRYRLSAGVREMSVISAEQRDAQPIDLPQLEKSLRHVRTLNSAVMSIVIGGMSVLAMVPLASVLWMLLKEGSARLGLSLFTELPPAAGMAGGGIGNALLGTIEVVALATLISVPFGILAAVFLAEFGPGSSTASGVRFCAKLLTGLPSILAGVFAYGAVVLATGTFSAPAAGVALALLMIPTVLLTAEEAICMVPAPHARGGHRHGRHAHPDGADA